MCAGVHIAGWGEGVEGVGGARPAGGRAAGVSEATSVVSLSAQCLVGGRAPLPCASSVFVCVGVHCYVHLCMWMYTRIHPAIVTRAEACRRTREFIY